MIYLLAFISLTFCFVQIKTERTSNKRKKSITHKIIIAKVRKQLEAINLACLILQGFLNNVRTLYFIFPCNQTNRHRDKQNSFRVTILVSPNAYVSNSGTVRIIILLDICCK